jgi:hypothetical protein
MALPVVYVAFSSFASLQVGSSSVLLLAVVVVVVVVVMPGDGKMVRILRPSAVWE